MHRPDHATPDDLFAIADAIMTVADAVPTDGPHDHGTPIGGEQYDAGCLACAFYREADEAYDLAIAMGGQP